MKALPNRFEVTQQHEVVTVKMHLDTAKVLRERLGLETDEATGELFAKLSHLK